MIIKLSNQTLKLGIIAGGGTAPYTLIDICQKTGRDFFVVCLEGQANEDLGHNVPHAWLPLGAAGKLKSLAEEQKIKEIVMIGHVRRPSLSEIKPDWLALKILTKIGINALGDDALLTAIGKALEEEGNLRVVGVQDIFAEFLTPEGRLGHVVPDAEAEKDIKRGIDVARVLGQLDVGQSVVVQQGMVLGVEAIEGTNALIARSAILRRNGVGGVLVKMAKPQQDNRYDLPTVGPDTIVAIAKAGLRGLALEAGRSLLIDREKMVALADEAGIFILARSL